ncbi:MAG: prepilin-type N-terminal cleavage/methylation domain-containing protein [Acidobacteriota bacterium]|nr:prepilin-type N-terminal cleavage/methylation domain-containing protein [Acidobacteriota bacterium]
MTERNPRAGLTLIEVLIAVSLLSLLTLGMMWAIRIGLNAMSKSNSKLMANRRITGAQRVLEQEIYGLIPASAELPTPAGAGSGQPGTGQKVQFFQGEPQSMRFVTSYSLREGSRGHAQILAFQVLPGDAGVGVRLIVNETPYSGSRSAGAFVAGRGFDPNINHVLTRFLPIEPASNSFVLADKLASCNFAYQEIRPRPEMQRWVPVWSLDQWPDAIRIDMTPLEEAGSRLHGVSVVAPVHVTRAALEVYDDN